jgi:hypothetical protein
MTSIKKKRKLYRFSKTNIHNVHSIYKKAQSRNSYFALFGNIASPPEGSELKLDFINLGILPSLGY